MGTFICSLQDIIDQVEQAAQNATSLNANPELGFVTSGVSVGANFAAVMSILARDQHLFPPLTGLYLSIPAIMAPETIPESTSRYG
jgi:acetyl esterase/lipase